jgi:peptidoglycan/LPS O-acetylase OafA/YrhL
VTAGFLVGYRHYGKLVTASLRQSWDYVAAKIARIWPVHFIAFLIISVYLAVSDPHDFFSLSSAWKAVVNLCLLQAWTTDPFTFNSVSWFVSALLFCYFASPFLMSVLRRSRCVIASAFAGCAALRIAIELWCGSGSVIPQIYLHTFPLIRCMEFFMGMLMVPAFYTVKETLESRDPARVRTGMTAAELIAASAYIFLMYRMEGVWIRGYFVPAACVLVFTYALNEGLISRLLSVKLFALFAMIQTEFYLFHQVIIRVLGPAITWMSHSVFVQSVILFFITVAASALYDRLLKEKCTAAAERILKRV